MCFVLLVCYIYLKRLSVYRNKTKNEIKLRKQKSFPLTFSVTSWSTVGNECNEAYVFLVQVRFLLSLVSVEIPDSCRWPT